MFKINDISIKDYFGLENPSEYDIFLESIMPENKLCGKICQMNKITFDEVEVLKKTFNAPNPEDLKDIFILLYGIRGDMKRSDNEEFYSESIFQLFRVINYFKKWLKDIEKKEREWLSNESNDVLAMLDAGKRLVPFNHLLSKIDIGEMFSRTPDQIGAWTYGKVFTIIVAIKVRREIQKEFNEIN